MASVARGVAIVCWIGACLLLPASGVTTGPSGATSGRPHGYIVTRCDGSQIQHAAPSSRAPAAPSSVYVGTFGSVGGGANGVFAFAAQDGSLRWCARFTINGGTYTCPYWSCPAPSIADVGQPLITGGVVYVCVDGAGGFTYAFNAADGALRWSRETECGMYGYSDESGQPILTDGVLYSGQYGLRPADGSIRWHLPLQAIIGAVHSGVVYASAEHTVYAIGVADSAVHWKYDVDAHAQIGDRPSVFGDHLYIGDTNGDSSTTFALGLPDTYALDAQTGALRWRSPTGMVVGSSAVEASGLVYIGGDNALDALDVATGAFRWRVTAPHPYVHSTPIVAAGTVYFTGQGAYGLDARTGAVRWHNTLGWSPSTAVTAPALVGDLLAAAVIDGYGHGTLVGLDAASGAIRWQRGGFNQIESPSVG